MYLPYLDEPHAHGIMVTDPHGDHPRGDLAGNFAVLVTAHAIGDNKDAEGIRILATTQHRVERKERVLVVVALLAHRLPHSDFQLGRFKPQLAVGQRFKPFVR
jgi:hypothetical protein